MRKRRGVAGGIVAGAGVVGLLILSLGTPQGCESNEGVIGRDGGILYSEDGRFSIEIPEDALDSEIQVSVVEVACDQPDEAACYEISPRGVAFRFPAVATFEAGELMSMEEISLAVEHEDGWQKMADQSVDRDDETVTASMLYLSAVCVQAK